LWKNGLPALSVLWLSEPDFSQHGAGPGSKVARAGLASSDDCLGQVLAALDTMKLRDQTDVMVVSDHGFSTVWQGIDIMDDLGLQGFEIGGLFLEKPQKGNVVMVGLGGSVAFYVIDHDAPTIAKLVSYLQTTPYAGVLFTKEKTEGTFALSDVGVDAPGAPDVLMSMRWRADKINREGAMPGLLLIEGKGYKTGQGMHGSLSRFDMRNTLVAAGPDFKGGFKSETPSANTDVAPTVLSILGITPKEPMDGRVLEEAFTGAPEHGPKVETSIMQANRAQGDKNWQQYLKISKVGNQTYYDEGNVGAPPEK
jgi:arylsulfatase A-like enzyme